MKNIIGLIFLCFAFIQCSNDEQLNNYTLYQTDTNIKIKIGKNELNHTFCNQYLTVNDSNFLAVLNQNLNKIFIYNLELQNLYKEFSIQTEGNNGFPNLLSFVIKNLDTIILVSPWPQSIGLMDSDGKIYKRISYEKDLHNNSLQSVAGMTGQRSFLIENHLNMEQHYRFDSTSGIMTLSMQEKTNVAISINIESGNIKLLSLKYPTDLIGKDFSGVSILRELGYNNCYVYNFGLSKDLYITQDFTNFKKVPILTNYDINLPKDQFKYMSDLPAGLNYLLKMDNIQNIHYDKYRECYYIIVRKRTNALKGNENFRIKFIFPQCLIIILDKNFKHMGDVHFPDNTFSFNDMFIAKEGLYISEDHVNNPTYSEDVMRFRLFKLKQIQQ